VGGETRRFEHDAQVPVLVVDDQARFRRVMRDLVAAADGFRLAGEADSGEAAVEAVGAVGARFVIMDKRMPGMGGIAACRAIVENDSRVVVLLCSVEELNPRLLEDCARVEFVPKERLCPRLLTEVWHRRRAHVGPISGATFVDAGPMI